MDGKKISKILANLNIRRDSIFTSISSKDKESALRLIKVIEEMHLNHWCMYYENGRDRNISGDRYPEVIANALSKCCVFLMLVSKHSIVSAEVKKELVQVTEGAKKDKFKNLKIIPIFLDDIKNDDIPEDIAKLSGITPQVIVRRMNEKTTNAEIKEICEEIRSQYLTVVFDSIHDNYKKEKNSQKFVNLMNACVKNKCVAQTVSEDIKESNEISAERLKEMHVLSNELIEYDCNTYSCMVIASNLLGNETIKNGKKVYEPLKNGVKYFYYFPESIKSECQIAFNKIKGFVVKDSNSRKEVVRLIRREFCFRNKVKTFFLGLNNMTQADFEKQYHIVEEKDKEAFDKLFAENDTQTYFAYSDEDDIFQVPEEFFMWLLGDVDKYSYDNIVQTSYMFISFLGRFVNLLENAQDINTVSFESLKKRYQYLVKLQRLEEWQMGKITVSQAESKRLVNYLLDYSSDSIFKSEKKFPRLSNWMEFEHDETGAIVPFNEQIINEAFSNLVGIPLKETDELKLCFSFALFVNESSMSGAWYSTGQKEQEGIIHDMVMTYNIERQSKIFEQLMDAFEYLVSINESVGATLKTHNSELLLKFNK